MFLWGFLLCEQEAELLHEWHSSKSWGCRETKMGMAVSGHHGNLLPLIGFNKMRVCKRKSASSVLAAWGWKRLWGAWGVLAAGGSILSLLMFLWMSLVSFRGRKCKNPSYFPGLWNAWQAPGMSYKQPRRRKGAL